MDVIQFLLLGLVLPIVINKTTERGRFDFIHAYLQEIWSGLLILCTYLYVLRNPTVKAILLSGYSKLSDYRGYLIVAGLSAALGCFYWWGTGKLLKEIKTPPMHPPHAGKVPAGTTLHPPTGDMQLTFKSSPILSRRVTLRITKDFTRFRDYLTGLGIPVPTDLPPIGTQAVANGSGSVTPLGLPAYRGKLELGEKLVNDRARTTKMYCDYAISTIMFAPDSPLQPALGDMPIPNMKNLGAATIFTEGLSTYLNMSFWNRTPRELDRGFWSGALWDIRKRFGRDFTDRMVAYAIRAMIDEPTKSSTDNLSHYLICQLKIGESVVDNDGKRWTTVLEILRSHGVITDQPAS